MRDGGALRPARLGATRISTRRSEPVLSALDAGVSAQSRRRVRRVVQRHGGTLEWIPLDPDRLADLPGNRWLPQISYARLFIPQLLPERFDKAIYLDCDTLVLENLRRLWARPVGGHSHLAVQDLGQPYVSSPEGVPDYETLGLPADAQYFNAGLMVMNLRRWRAERIGAQVMRYAHRHGRPALPRPDGRQRRSGRPVGRAGPALESDARHLRVCVVGA